MKDNKRQDILKAAMETFARKGFRGTTTRDLAAQAEVNEAIIFRYFKTKEDLYRAILEEKFTQGRDLPCAELEQLKGSDDDQAYLEFVGRRILEKHQDTTFMRLLLFSALEGHELADMVVSVIAERDPIADYFARRMDEGALRRMDSHLAARAFVGMFISFSLTQEIFGQKKHRVFDVDAVVRTFVSIFLTGIKQ